MLPEIKINDTLPIIENTITKEEFQLNHVNFLIITIIWQIIIVFYYDLKKEKNPNIVINYIYNYIVFLIASLNFWLLTHNNLIFAICQTFMQGLTVYGFATIIIRSGEHEKYFVKINKWIYKFNKKNVGFRL